MSEKKTILVCCGTGCTANGSRDVYNAFKSQLENDKNVDIIPDIKGTGCHGLCQKGPIVHILPLEVTYIHVKEEDVSEIYEKTILNDEVVESLLYYDKQKKSKIKSKDNWTFDEKQLRLALRNVGHIANDSIEDYIKRDGYKALYKAFKMTPSEIIETVQSSGLRGRGGGGFPTGLKWSLAAEKDETPKYIICNADEGDPGAFMDRSVLEGDPHSVLESMIICAYAIGAQKGFIYVRDEYELAVKNINKAIKAAKERSYLGENILDSGLNFDVEIVRGGGAFVCGEETALIASIEGNPGEPVQKPPYPTDKGLWGKPTIINNVETWANISLIINKGAEWFKNIGTKTSSGTKVFSLVGKIENTGLVEIPMGITLRELIFDIGGGVPKGRKFKAVQTGGPSGGCISEKNLDLPVDFDSLTAAGSMMGSGGMVVMDDRTCMVEVARYYMEFLYGESCGKCAPCREGIKKMLEILNDICEGRGEEGDIELLLEISEVLKEASLCALGKTAANPVVSSINNFREEFEEHIKNKRCPAGVCKNLTEFYIDEEVCVGCSACLKKCPVDAISGEKKEPHKIDQEKCIKCGACIDNCKFNAVKVK